MLDTAAMQDEFEAPIADTPRLIKTRPPSQLIPVEPQAKSINWLSPKNMIFGGMGIASVGILIAAAVSMQPKPAEKIEPFTPQTLISVAPQILAENKEKQARSLDDLNRLVEEGLDQDDKVAIRILAARLVIDSNKAVQTKDDTCFKSEIGLDCYLNGQERVWSDRRKSAVLAKDAGQISLATLNLRAIELAREGKVELVESDPELVELALRNRFNARIDILTSSANEKARRLNSQL